MVTVTDWIDWTTLAANIITIILFVAGGIAAVFAGKRYFREKKHERLIHLYGLVNGVFRAELSLQHRAKSNAPVDPSALVAARAELKNWYYDNRFLFDDDSALKPLIDEADDEAQTFVKSLSMDHVKRLKAHIERDLGEAP
jgi:hypothetical protein